MTFVASAIRYRPRRWSEVLDQDVTVRILQNAIRLNRVASAYLFEGRRGCGKTTIARLLAKTLNCPTTIDAGGVPEPCCGCSSCQDMEQGRSSDLLELDAASHRGIDDARELQKVARLQTRPGATRVVILDEAHMLTKEAQNALLALFESPPPGFLPVLCTTDSDKILPTIKSRCMRFQIRPLTHQAITRSLVQIFRAESQPIETESLYALARVAGGSLRDVQHLADQLISSACGQPIDDAFLEGQLGVPTVSLYRSVVGALAAAWADGPAVWFETIDSLYSGGTDMRMVFFQVIPTLLRDLRVSLVSRGYVEPVVAYDCGIPHEVFEQRNRFSHHDLHLLWEAWEEQSELFGQLGEREHVEFFFLKAWGSRTTPASG